MFAGLAVSVNGAGSLLGQGNASRSGNAAAFAAHNFQHIVFTAFESVTFQQFYVLFGQAVDFFRFDFDFVTDQAGNSSVNTAGNRELAALGMLNFGKGIFAAFVNIYVRSNQHCAQFFKSENIVDIGIIFGFCPFGQAGADEDRYAAGIFIFNQFGSIIHRRFG